MDGGDIVFWVFFIGLPSIFILYDVSQINVAGLNEDWLRRSLAKRVHDDLMIAADKNKRGMREDLSKLSEKLSYESIQATLQDFYVENCIYRDRVHGFITSMMYGSLKDVRYIFKSEFDKKLNTEGFEKFSWYKSTRVNVSDRNKDSYKNIDPYIFHENHANSEVHLFKYFANILAKNTPKGCAPDENPFMLKYRERWRVTSFSPLDSFFQIFDIFSMQKLFYFKIFFIILILLMLLKIFFFFLKSYSFKFNKYNSLLIIFIEKAKKLSFFKKFLAIKNKNFFLKKMFCVWRF